MSLQLKEEMKAYRGLYGLVLIFAVTLILLGSYQRADAQQKTFKTPEEAEWHIFKLRWKHATGVELREEDLP